MKFTKSTGAKAQGDAIVFSLDVNGVTRQFEISGDVLRRRFGARDGSAAELLHAFENGRTRCAMRPAARSIPTEGVIRWARAISTDHVPASPVMTVAATPGYVAAAAATASSWVA